MNWKKPQGMSLVLEVREFKRGAKMTVSYKTMRKNKRLDEFNETAEAAVAEGEEK